MRRLPIRSGDPPDPQVPMRQAMSEISVIDDAGHSYDLSAVLVGTVGPWSLSFGGAVD
jgi:hypothetical protein